MSNEAPSGGGEERATDGGVLDNSARDADDRSDAVDVASILSDDTGTATAPSHSTTSVSSESTTSVSSESAGSVSSESAGSVSSESTTSMSSESLPTGESGSSVAGESAEAEVDSRQETAGDASVEETGASDARVCWLDEDDAGEVIGALSSETARSMVTALQSRRQTASELAEEVDTSVQNVRHHLQNLREAGLIEEAGTRYSVKGREMTVYAASEDQIVVAVGSEDDSGSFFESLRGLLTGITALAAGSGLVQWALGAPETVTRVPDSTGGTASVIGGGSVVPPGLVFFAGGLLVLAAVVLAVNSR